MIIGIDTAQNKKYSCVIFGFETEIKRVFEEIDSVLINCGEKGEFHWKHMKLSAKNCAFRKIADILNQSQLKIMIFEHSKIANTSEKEFYLKVVPNEISLSLERLLKNKYGFVLIECDNDFSIKKCRGNGTFYFLESLLEKITFRLTGQMVKLRKEKNILKASVKLYNEKILNFNACVSDRKSSQSIQLSDISLGLWNFAKEVISEKVYFRKL